MRRVLPLLVLAASFASVAPARAETHLVRLANGRFNPPTLEIAVGDRIQWLVQESGHTISASDYRFDYEPARTLTIGETREWTFTEDETFRYICRVHAPAMSGVITVGEGSPPPPPPPPISGDSRRVPLEYPTIDAALVGIPPDSEIVLEPGTYEPFEIAIDDLLVRGATPLETMTPGRATVDGGLGQGGLGIAKTGILVTGDQVAIRDLDVVSVADDAIVITGDDATISFAAIHAGYRSGINVRGASRSRIHDVTVAASPASTGIALDDPNAARIDRVTVAGAKSGLRAVGGNGVVIRSSTFAGSGTGIALRGTLGSPLLGVDVLGSSITQTANPQAPPGQSLDLVTGAGIWVDGAWSVRLARNTITRTLSYGIAVTAFAGPSLDVRSIGNTVTETGIAAEGWDGIGTFCTDATSATEPPTMPATNPCGSPRPGVPYPKVDADLLAHAFVGTAVQDTLP